MPGVAIIAAIFKGMQLERFVADPLHPKTAQQASIGYSHRSGHRCPIAKAHRQTCLVGQRGQRHEKRPGARGFGGNNQPLMAQHNPFIRMAGGQHGQPDHRHGFCQQIHVNHAFVFAGRCRAGAKIGLQHRIIGE